MTDLDSAALRQALKAPGDPAAPVDVSKIMTRGRKLRTRRRLAAVAGGLGVAAVLAGTATAIANLTAAPPAPGQPVGPAQHGPARPGPAEHRPTEHQPPRPAPSLHHGPAPVVVPTTGSPATATPAISGANPEPFPTGSPSATPTALPTQTSQPTSTVAPTTAGLPSGATTRARSQPAGTPVPVVGRASR
jgi:hypothetical protein